MPCVNESGPYTATFLFSGYTIVAETLLMRLPQSLHHVYSGLDSTHWHLHYLLLTTRRTTIYHAFKPVPNLRKCSLLLESERLDVRVRQ